MRHPRRWLVLLGLGALIGSGALLWRSTTPAVPPPPSTATRPAPPAPLPRAPQPGHQAPLAPTAPADPGGWHHTWQVRTEAVAQRCGLTPTSTCAGTTCASVVTGPDLDRPWGWLQLSWQSPSFVLNTALRDLGLPPAALPCGQAIDALTHSGGIRAVELPDGTEIWCVADDQGDDPAQRQRIGQLCDTLARELEGDRAARFTEDGLRQLSFDR